MIDSLNLKKRLLSVFREPNFFADYLSFHAISFKSFGFSLAANPFTDHHLPDAKTVSKFSIKYPILSIHVLYATMMNDVFLRKSSKSIFYLFIRRYAVLTFIPSIEILYRIFPILFQLE